MNRFTPRCAFAAALLTLGAAAAHAQAVLPVAYDTYNGSGYYYRDDTYTGGPYGENSFMLGGIGQLADGAWTSSPFNFDVSPYVAWTYDPFIRFHFASPTNVGRIRVHVDHEYYAGVSSPSAIIVGPASQTFGAFISSTTYLVNIPVPPNPYWIDIDLSGQGLTGVTELGVRMTRSNEWLFVDEVQFEELSAVPEPASLVLLATGMIGIAFATRRRSRAS